MGRVARTAVVGRRDMTRALALGVVIALGGARANAAPACIAADDTVQTDKVAAALTLCAATSGCWRVELATGAWTRTGDSPPPTPVPAATTSAAGSDSDGDNTPPDSLAPPPTSPPPIKVCPTATTCHRVTSYERSGDGVLVATLEHGRVEIYHARTGQPVATIRTDLWTTAMSASTGVERLFFLPTARRGRDVSAGHASRDAGDRRRAPLRSVDGRVHRHDRRARPRRRIASDRVRAPGAMGRRLLALPACSAAATTAGRSWCTTCGPASSCWCSTTRTPTRSSRPIASGSSSCRRRSRRRSA